MPEQRRGGYPRPSSRLWFGAACAFSLGVAGMTAAAWGAFEDQVSAAMTLRTATLEPPTLVTAAAGTCVAGVRDAIVLDWTASTTADITGYEILRATASAGPYSPVATVTGREVQTYTDTSVSFATTYHYVLRSIAGNWLSVQTAPTSRATRSPQCL